MYSIEADTALEGWIHGVNHLYTDGDLFNLVTTIYNPTMYNADWLKDFNPSNIVNGVPSTSDVITTIFPYKYRDRGLSRNDMYIRYMKVHNRAKRIHPARGRRWGTYFLRMISFGENNINQLENIISSLNNWSRNSKTAFVMHISSADTDSLRPLGGPCLQFLEFLCPDRNSISLLAVYRNHDYFSKVLGNFIGLGQLLKYVAEETNRTPLRLTCHSAHAYFDCTKKEMKDFAHI